MIKNRLFNDLAWAISSPPLIVMPGETCQWYGSDFYSDLYHTSSDWFSELERNPEKLQALVEAQKDKRLGKLFETLWAAYLNDSERFEVVEQGLQIVDAGRTLGEIDLIVVDRKTHKMIHWELAVKFYLGFGDTRQWKNWYGPAKKDRLDLKMNHLINHQTVLCQQEATTKILRSKNIKIDSSAVIMKGCLFYPSVSTDHEAPQFANIDHCRRRWVRLSALKDCFENETRYHPLIGEGWMADLDVTDYGEAYTLSDIQSLISSGECHLPLLLSVINQGVESEKIFVVRNDWHKQ